MHLQAVGKKHKESEPYTICEKVVLPVRLGFDKEAEEAAAREEAGGAKKKSTRGALMIGDTQFKRWNVPANTKADPEKEDERDVWLLKEMHFQMNYADTYMELSASKLFAVDYFDRGISITCILTYCICAGILIQTVETYRDKFLVNLGDGYAWPANFLWWNSLQAWNYMMIAHSFGILQFLIIPIIRRLYYIMFSLSLTGLVCAYLQKQGCFALCPWIWWTSLIITIMTSGRSPISNRMGNPLADDVFFGIFLLMGIQAICAKDENMMLCTLLLFIAFAYAGPIGYWGWFNWRVVIYTICIYFSLPLIEEAVSKKTGGYTPKTLLNFINNDWRKILPYIHHLPVSWGCPLKNCEPGLYALFEGGPLGRWHADEDEGKEKGGWWSEGFSLDFLDAFGVELPPSFDDGLFWFFVLFMVLFDIYTLWVLEVVKDTEAPPPTPCTPYDLTTNKDFEMLC
jgi:hypothetical protein